MSYPLNRDSTMYIDSSSNVLNVVLSVFPYLFAIFPTFYSCLKARSKKKSFWYKERCMEKDAGSKCMV